MFKLNNDNMDNTNSSMDNLNKRNVPILNPKLATSLQKSNLGMPINIPDNVENDFLKNFIEISKDQLDQLQKNDFIRYKLKSDGELKKGGYIVDIISRTLKSGVEKVYIKISFNKSFINNGRVGTYQVSVDNIDKLYKKIENQMEYTMISNSINGLSDNIGSDISNLYEMGKNKELEIIALKSEIEELKKESKKTEDRLKKIVGYIKEISDRINTPTKK